MRKEVVNPFISAATSVFLQEYKLVLSRKSLTTKSSPIPSLAVAVSIGVTGKLKGMVVYSMSEQMAYALAALLMPDKSPETIKKHTDSVIGEMGNVITGQVTMALDEDLGIDCDITPPFIHRGENMTTNYLELETIVLTALCDLGELEINISLTE